MASVNVHVAARRVVSLQDLYLTPAEPGDPAHCAPALHKGRRGRRQVAVRIPSEPATGNAATYASQLDACWRDLANKTAAEYGGEYAAAFRVQVAKGEKPQVAHGMPELLRLLDRAVAAGLEPVVFAVMADPGGVASRRGFGHLTPLLPSAGGSRPGDSAVRSVPGDAGGSGNILQPADLYLSVSKDGETKRNSRAPPHGIHIHAAEPHRAARDHQALEGRVSRHGMLLLYLALALVAVTLALVGVIAWLAATRGGPSSSPATTVSSASPPVTPAVAPAPATAAVASPPAPAITRADAANYNPPMPGDVPTNVVRWFYIATEDLQWSFAPMGVNTLTGDILPPKATQIVTLTTYNGYEDDTFTTETGDNTASWTAIMGPPIRAEVGDLIRVKMINRASQTYSIHPHGLRYDLPNSGSDDIGVSPNINGGVVSSGQGVAPGQSYTYSWYVGSDAGPLLAQNDPYFQSTVVWPYHSHYNEPVDVQRGLFGPLIIAARGCANSTGGAWDLNKENEYVLFFMNMATPLGTFYTVNGIAYGNLGGVVVQRGQPARFHILTLGTTQDLHPIHWHAKTVKKGNDNLDTITISPGLSTTVDFTSFTPGKWLLHCHADDHLVNGMWVWYYVTGNSSDETGVPLRGVLPAAAHLAAGNYDTSKPANAWPDNAVRNVDVLKTTFGGSGASVVKENFNNWPPPSPGTPTNVFDQQPPTP